MTRVNYIKNLQSMINDAEDMGLYDEDVESLQVAIKALEQEPKTGHWIYHKEKPFISVEHWECSECHRTVEFYPFIVKTSFDMPNDYNTMYFCPKCGAKMESEE